MLLLCKQVATLPSLSLPTPATSGSLTSLPLDPVFRLVLHGCVPSGQGSQPSRGSSLCCSAWLWRVKTYHAIYLAEQWLPFRTQAASCFLSGASWEPSSAGISPFSLDPVAPFHGPFTSNNGVFVLSPPSILSCVTEYVYFQLVFTLHTIFGAGHRVAR